MDWSLDQALAVFEIADLLRERLWAALQAAAAALGGLPAQQLAHPARLLGLTHHLGPVACSRSSAGGSAATSGASAPARLKPTGFVRYAATN